MNRFWILALIVTGSDAVAGEWKRLPSLPDKEGFAGSFAGVSHGALLVAGGANFPEKKPWEGGKKVWYDKVYVLEKPGGMWQAAGRLPRPLGYGVSVTHGNGVVCAGGSDAKRHGVDVFRLEWKDSRLRTIELPHLPKPRANACGALVGATLFVAGGQEKPDDVETRKTVFRIDLSAREPKWEEIEPCPGRGRMLAVACGFAGAFWLVGGADLVAGKSGRVERQFLRDAYRYDPGTGWKRIADLPYPVVAAPSPAPADAEGFYLLGGDDGSQVGVAAGKHRGFRKPILRYDAKNARWVEAGELPAPRVTVPCLLWDKSWVVPGGEVRPGIRSPEVWSFTPRRGE